MLASETPIAGQQTDSDGRSAGLRSTEWLPRYSSSRNDLIADFYAKALDRSIQYDRAVGYFRSSFYSLTASATARFALADGTIRLACAPELTEDDLAALERGLEAREIIDAAVQRELSRILESPMSYTAIQLLGALVATRALEM